MTTVEAQEAIVKLQPRTGDILFIDRNAVDLMTLSKINWPEEAKGVIVLAVNPQRNCSVQESLHLLSKAQAIELLKEISNA